VFRKPGEENDEEYNKALAGPTLLVKRFKDYVSLTELDDSTPPKHIDIDVDESAAAPFCGVKPRDWRTCAGSPHR